MKKYARRNTRIKRILVIWALLGGIGLVWVLYTLFHGIVWLFRPEKEALPGQIATQIQREKGEDGENAEGNKEFVYVEAQPITNRDICSVLYEEYGELLILVNREHSLEEETYRDSLRNICNGRLQASKVLYKDLVDLLAAAGAEGYQYWIASAYRSRERQQELVDEDVTRYMRQGMNRQEALEKTYKQTMPAGCSEHETGLALDILCSENVNMDLTQALEPGNRWLAEHAHEYGFILRYPEGKEEITGIFYEPWHFRYVGKEAAKYLHENQLTLEEFHACLN